MHSGCVVFIVPGLCWEARRRCKRWPRTERPRRQVSVRRRQGLSPRPRGGGLSPWHDGTFPCLRSAAGGVGRLRIWVRVLLVRVESAATSSSSVTTAIAATRDITTSATVKAPSAEASSAASPAARHTGDVGSLGYDLDVATLEHRVVEDESLGNQAGLGEFDVCVTLGLACELIKQDGHAVDRTTLLEVGLDLLGRDRVIDVANEDTTAVDVTLVLVEFGALLLQAGLHLAQLGSLLLHLGNSSFHGRDLLLIIVIVRSIRCDLGRLDGRLRLLLLRDVDIGHLECSWVGRPLGPSVACVGCRHQIPMSESLQCGSGRAHSLYNYTLCQPWGSLTVQVPGRGEGRKRRNGVEGGGAAEE